MFRNEPLLDFSIADVRHSFQHALDALDARIVTMSLVVGPIIDGRELSSRDPYERYDPSNREVLIGTVSMASEEQALAALQSVRRGSAAWRSKPWERRAELVRKAAQLLRRERLFLAALMVREAGKPWKEADADAAEAIDFCEYYANEMARIGPWRKTEDVAGEDNFYFYQARGTALAISPWNFPLAIMVGMSIAALITGNTTIIKPAEQTSCVAFEFAKLLLEAGFPPDSFAFLPGYGENVGRLLVASPEIDLIAFTGSKAVGLEILKRTADISPGQYHLKKAILELGGKNAIIVDQDADLDEAVKGVLYSAFGYSGQKCSACSRIIVVGDAYEPFIERLSEASASILVGAASDPSSFLGPVIDQESQERILSTIQQAEATQRVAFKGTTPTHGWYVPPTLFRDVDTQSPLWRDEIFGPVVAAVPAKTFDAALQLAADSQYALTGGLFSRSPAHIQRAHREFPVGNLYINRGCTGAMVGRQPFGGFKLSGIGSKAGGPDYLLQFVEPRTVSENTLRRGFAPD